MVLFGDAERQGTVDSFGSTSHFSVNEHLLCFINKRYYYASC